MSTCCLRQHSVSCKRNWINQTVSLHPENLHSSACRHQARKSVYISDTIWRKQCWPMGDSTSSRGEPLMQSKSLLRYQTQGLNQLVSLSLQHSNTFPIISMSLQTLVPTAIICHKGRSCKTKKQKKKTKCEADCIPFLLLMSQWFHFGIRL